VYFLGSDKFQRQNNIALPSSLCKKKPGVERAFTLFHQIVFVGCNTVVTGSFTKIINLEVKMIRKLKSGEYRLYSRKKDPKTGKRRNLGTFDTREAAEKHEREVQYFKRH